MIYIVYTLRYTERARSDAAGFWAWYQKDCRYFMKICPSVKELKAYTVAMGAHNTLEEWVGLENFAALDQYYAELAAASRSDVWPARIAEYYRWMEIVESRTLRDAPVSLAPGEPR